MPVSVNPGSSRGWRRRRGFSKTASLHHRFRYNRFTCLRSSRRYQPCRFYKRLHRGRLCRGLHPRLIPPPEIPIPSPIPPAAVVVTRTNRRNVAHFIDILMLFEKIGNVQKRVPFEADIDERRLHARQDARHTSLMDAPCQRVLIGSLEVHLHQLVFVD
jgi:hypothetical protein